jgi:threonine synthase
MKSKLVGVGVHTLEDTGLKLQGKPSIADKLYTPYTPYKDRIEEILKDGHLYVHVSDKEIQEAYEKVSRIIYCEPSSAAVFAALPKLTIGEKSKVILINSGKGIWPVHAAAN